MISNVNLDVALRSCNDAFVEDPAAETARILRELADDIAGSTTYCEGILKDVNGNRVGSFSFTVEEA